MCLATVTPVGIEPKTSRRSTTTPPRTLKEWYELNTQAGHLLVTNVLTTVTAESDGNGDAKH